MAMICVVIWATEVHREALCDPLLPRQKGRRTLPTFSLYCWPFSKCHLRGTITLFRFAFDGVLVDYQSNAFIVSVNMQDFNVSGPSTPGLALQSAKASITYKEFHCVYLSPTKFYQRKNGCRKKSTCERYTDHQLRQRLSLNQLYLPILHHDVRTFPSWLRNDGFNTSADHKMSFKYDSALFFFSFFLFLAVRKFIFSLESFFRFGEARGRSSKAKQMPSRL